MCGDGITKGLSPPQVLWCSEGLKVTPMSCTSGYEDHLFRVNPSTLERNFHKSSCIHRCLNFFRGVTRLKNFLLAFSGSVLHQYTYKQGTARKRGVSMLSYSESL